ncbi:hypothetical protein SKAU_G00373410 [Synaphobranchus kaupii]|uniref:Uncharacterized protein n=1 Tax=Synaphobranchus kaupii TaxID=118154 RepID=A0A9Q1EGJ2_SYNKA|nr:hypothetical protein SKAU_G00373410 [Synaphobranchus kaupii]
MCQSQTGLAGMFQIATWPLFLRARPAASLVLRAHDDSHINTAVGNTTELGESSSKAYRHLLPSTKQ